MELEVVNLDQIGGVDGLFDGFELQGVDMNAIAAGNSSSNNDNSNAGNATPPMVHSTADGDFDGMSFELAMQARLEAAMKTAVHDIAAENGEELEVVKTEGGLQIVNLGAPSGGQSAELSSSSSCTPTPGGTCATLISTVLYWWGWCSHGLAAADLGLDIAFAASIAAEHPAYAGTPAHTTHRTLHTAHRTLPGWHTSAVACA